MFLLLFSLVSFAPLSPNFVFSVHFHFLLYLKHVYFFVLASYVSGLNVIPNPLVVWDIRFNDLDARRRMSSLEAQSTYSWLSPATTTIGSIFERRANCGPNILATRYSVQTYGRPGFVNVWVCIRLPQWEYYWNVFCGMQPHGFIDGRSIWIKKRPKGRESRFQDDFIGCASTL